MAITDEQLKWWEHLAEPIPQLIQEVRELRDQVQAQKEILSFISLHAFACVQYALGPLEEIRQKMLWEIKKAASHGEFPNWYDPKSPEWKLP